MPEVPRSSEGEERFAPGEVALAVRRAYERQLDTAQEVLAYGLRLIPRCIDARPGSDAHLAIINAVGHRAMLLYDAVLVCLEAGAVRAAELPARGLLEADLAFAWLMTGDAERAGNHIIVAEFREMRRIVLKFVPGSAEHARFTRAWIAKHGQVLEEDARERSSAEGAVDLIDRALSEPPFVEISRAFDTYIANKRLPYEPAWYQPLGAESIQAIAKALGRESEYLLFYSRYSRTTHGRLSGLFDLDPIRSLTGFDDLFQLASSLALSVTSRLVQHFAPHEGSTWAEHFRVRWEPGLRSTDIDEGATLPSTTLPGSFTLPPRKLGMTA